MPFTPSGVSATRRSSSLSFKTATITFRSTFCAPQGDGGAAVGAAVFDQALAPARGGAFAAQEAPDLDEALAAAASRQLFQGLETDTVVGGAGREAHREGVEVLPRPHLDDLCQMDPDVIHVVAVAERPLLLELHTEALVDAVGQEGAHGREILPRPGPLDPDFGGRSEDALLRWL